MRAQTLLFLLLLLGIVASCGGYEIVIVKLANGGTSRPIKLMPLYPEEEEEDHHPEEDLFSDTDTLPDPEALVWTESYIATPTTSSSSRAPNNVLYALTNSENKTERSLSAVQPTTDNTGSQHTKEASVTGKHDYMSDIEESLDAQPVSTLDNVGDPREPREAAGNDEGPPEPSSSSSTGQHTTIKQKEEATISSSPTTSTTTIESTTSIPTTTTGHQPSVPSSSSSSSTHSPLPPTVPTCHQSCLAALNATRLYSNQSLILSQGSDLTLICELPLESTFVLENLIWLFHPDNSPVGQCSLTTQEFLPSCQGFQTVKNTDDRTTTFLRETLTLMNMLANHTGQYMCQVSTNQGLLCTFTSINLLSTQAKKYDSNVFYF